VAARRNAKPASQPFIFAGRTEANLQWKPEVSGFAIEIHARVDTGAAQFRTTPRYFANVIGPREVKPLIGGKEFPLIIDGFPRVSSLSDETNPHFVNTDTDDRKGFHFSLFIPAMLIDLKTVKL